jgi:hypothetical protein
VLQIIEMFFVNMKQVREVVEPYGGGFRIGVHKSTFLAYVKGE